MRDKCRSTVLTVRGMPRKKILLLMRVLAAISVTALTSQKLPAQSYNWSTIAGSAGQAGAANGTNSGARFNQPGGIAVASASELYVSDTENHTIRKISRTGNVWTVTTIAGLAGNQGSADGTNSDARFSYPVGLALADGDLYVACYLNHTIRKITQVGTNWVVSTVAGLAGNQGSADGTNDVARFKSPEGVLADGNGNLYVADTANQTIRKLSRMGTNWSVKTLCGLAGFSGTADGTNSDARFYFPFGIAMASSNALWVTDDHSHTIRQILLDGTNSVVSTIAGTPAIFGTNDGIGTNAHFHSPHGITAISSERAWVADSGNYTVRSLAPLSANCEVMTVAGSAGLGGSTDGTNALFRFPIALAADQNHNLYVTDTENNTIRFGQFVPELRIGPVGSDVVLSWPRAANNFVLEMSDSLIPGALWTPVSNTAAIYGDSFFLTNSTTGATAFYRLRKE
jgi:hypothetical protein